MIGDLLLIIIYFCVSIFLIYVYILLIKLIVFSIKFIFNKIFNLIKKWIKNGKNN